MTLWMAKVTTDHHEVFNPNLNVFGYYTSLTVINEANALMDAIEAQLFPPMVAIQASHGSIVQLEVIELNGSSYGLRTYPLDAYPGERTGQEAPPFVAWSFKIVKSVLGKRSGGKRIGTISQEDFEGRDPVVGVSPLLDDFAEQLAAPLTVGLVETWFPVILERPDPPSTVWGQHGVGGAFFEAVSTQNTRKK